MSRSNKDGFWRIFGLTIAGACVLATSVVACGVPQQRPEITVREALSSDPGQYTNPVVVIGELQRPYGIVLKQSDCRDPCEFVVSLRIPSDAAALEAVGRLNSDSLRVWKRRSGRISVRLLVNLVYKHDQRPPPLKVEGKLAELELVDVISYDVED
jgi:hypothetical protein